MRFIKGNQGRAQGPNLPDSSINWLPSFTVSGGGTWPDPHRNGFLHSPHAEGAGGSKGNVTPEGPELPKQRPARIGRGVHAEPTKHQHQ